jgi:hypothetical protein
MSDSYESEFESVTISEPGKGRKRKRAPENWKKNIKKREINSSKGKHPLISCQHLNGFCEARSLSNDNIKAVFDNFYSTQNKVTQDSMISSLMTANEPKRRRSVNNSKQRQVSIEYKIPNGNKFVKVCAKTFRSIFQIGVTRVNNIATYVKTNNNVRPERRGGKRLNAKYEEYRAKVKEHVSKFRCKSGHYSRKDSTYRKYLPSNLNIAKMHKIFLQENPLSEIKYNFYQKVFINDFNLGFGSPRKDICSYCTKQKCLIRIEKDTQKKSR